MQHGRAVTVAVVALAACESAPSSVPDPQPGAKPPPAAAAAFAAELSPDVVGTIAPTAVTAGDYAMSLAMSFRHFVTTELLITDTLDGALQLALAADGSARACIGSHHHFNRLGQREYRPNHDNEHVATDDQQLEAFVGTWKTLDGVATIELASAGHGTCTPGSAGTPGALTVELRCIGVAGNAPRPPPSSLACRITPATQGPVVGMPMTVASRAVAPPRSSEGPPAGGELVIAAGSGVAVVVTQDRNMTLPSFAFTAGAAVFEERAYRK